MVEIRPFARRDREQLTRLADAWPHIQHLYVEAGFDPVTASSKSCTPARSTAYPYRRIRRCPG